LGKSLSLLSLALCATWTNAASIDCPLLRPPALRPADVDRIVLEVLGKILNRPPRLIDVSKTLQALQDDPNPSAEFAIFMVRMSESLGFEAADVFHEAARKKGGSSAYEALTVADYQSSSRAEYARGRDAPPPAAVEGREYPLYRISIKPPSPASGWQVMRCVTEQIVFQRMEPGVGTTSAMASNYEIPEFRDDEAFLEYAKEQTSSAIGKGMAVQSFNIALLPGTAGKCADFQAVMEVYTMKYRMNGRHCRRMGAPHVGYSMAYSHFGTGAEDRFSAEANAFLRQLSEAAAK